jgi:ribonuclease HII
MDEQVPPRRIICSMRHELELIGAGIRPVAGVDEAGRGPLAGPVVAGAVILPEAFAHPHLTDSKQLSPNRREAIYSELVGREEIAWAVAVVSPEEIDRINILRATHEAMRRAVERLPTRPAHALIDGSPVRGFPIPHTPIVKGDSISLSIAAASVLAKVTRDRIMDALDAEFPHYGFAAHKGYPTPLHLERLNQYGPCQHHRRTFGPVSQMVLPLA